MWDPPFCRGLSLGKESLTSVPQQRFPDDKSPGKVIPSDKSPGKARNCCWGKLLMEFASNTPIGEKIDKIKRQICEVKLRLLDNGGNPLVPTGIMESDSEVESIYDETASLRISTRPTFSPGKEFLTSLPQRRFPSDKSPGKGIPRDKSPGKAPECRWKKPLMECLDAEINECLDAEARGG
nr:hypothetical protein [Tanacetum cinerariifolium]